MPRDRKAVEARKKRARQEEQADEISGRNEYGYSDPTAYEALRAITREEQKSQAAHGERGRQF